MGKSTRRAKATGDVSIMDLVSPSSSSMGVLTRAKTLALQRGIQSDAVLSPPKPPSCYLELRSRRLEKTPPQHNSRKARPVCGFGEPEMRDGEDGIQMDLDVSRPRARSSRESTPCSLIMVSDTISPPVSTRKQTLPPSAASNRRALLLELSSMPEWEEHFTLEEQLQQRLFTEKYNFDIVNEKPLPGRYEWVKVNP